MTSGEVKYSNTTVKTNKVALFKRKPRQISFMLVDSILSHRDGNRLAHLIRKNRISVPIFAVSGNHGITQGLVKLGAGMEGNLTKPFYRVELLANHEATFRETTVCSFTMECDENLI